MRRTTFVSRLAMGFVSLMLRTSALGDIPSPISVLHDIDNPAADHDPWSRRTRLVNIDLDALFTDPDPAGRDAPAAERIRLDIFPGTSITATRRDRDLGLGDTPLWFGEIEGEQAAYIILVRNDESFWGRIVSQRLGRFEIAFVAPGIASIREVNLDTLPSCGTDDRLAIGKPNDNERDPHADAGQERTTTNADVGLVYTSAVLASFGGNSATVSAFLDTAIADTNLILANSQISMRVRAAFKAETNYVQDVADMSLDLIRLADPSDGFMDNIHALRETHGADLVALIINTPTNACGIAFIMLSVVPAFEDYAFSVTALPCIAGSTLTHELGHNFGCAHDRANAGSASYSYAYGFRTSNSLYRTVMAYPPGSRLPYFSNPNVYYYGYRMGVPVNEPSPCFNAQAINLNTPTVTNFRPEPIAPPQLPGPFLLLQPGDESTLPDTSPIFSWAASSSAQSYRLQLDENPSFSAPILNAVTGFRSMAIAPGTLNYRTRYFWRVIASNTAGSTTALPGPFWFRTGACLGDANYDRTITFADITKVLENWGAQYTLGEGGFGDANADDAVTFADVTKILENWGSLCP